MSVPKAVLYHSPDSVWSFAVRLALEEKGYGPDEYTLKTVDISKGENFSISFLRLSPKGLVPTLVVPFADSLGQDVESRYKALTDPRAIVQLLDKSRSSLSRTHTTSTAPAPALAPATIEFSTTSNALLDLLHSDEVSPDALKFTNARDDSSLKTLAKEILPIALGRQKALAEYLSEAEAGSIQASEKVKAFWRDSQTENEELLTVLLAADKPESALDAAGKTKRAELFSKNKAAWEAVDKTLQKLTITGPYVLGDQLSLPDLSLVAWLRNVVILAGGVTGDDGKKAMEKLEARCGFKDSTGNLGLFWDAMEKRDSWKKVMI
ncbi:hypothetical protein FB45DRAFT_833735 [Roridomyces roridus]|uniref:GST N-terminal domain-containing protein n=1 Tax=Roridomyces roridus TaxID=1738132 RepID=A0AAD7BUJ9_9AGAR|nr:hypothetical protein FB45DRAFT_833735 [Roridomyces roridus]